METASSWRRQQHRHRNMLVYHYQDCKENPKYFYHAAYDTFRWKKSIKIILAFIFVFILCNWYATSYMWISTTPPVKMAWTSEAYDKEFDADPDLLHLNYLNDICIQEKEAVISWSYNSSKVDRSLVLTPNMPDSLIIQLLSECPDVDVFLPSSIRDHGYCEDSMAYVKYLESRALPAWVFDTEFRHQGKRYTYFDICPHSAIIFMNHYWNDLPSRPDFPSTKKVILMPNVEMYELKADHYRRVDYVFAKTQDAYHRIRSWFEQEGNPRGAQVIYTQHTTSDPTLLARLLAQRDSTFGSIRPKNFQSVSFLHVNGRSVHKNTRALLDCWKTRPDFPLLSVYSKDEPSKTHFHEIFSGEPPRNIDYHHGEEIDPIQFGRLLAEASVILCPSVMEGFGHYINQARAAGALVVTTNGFPMNEFIDANSGVLIDAELYNPPIWNADFWSFGQVMGRHYKVIRNWRVASGMEWDVSSNAICNAIDVVLSMSPNDREDRAKEGQERYISQLQYFKKSMFEFRIELRRILSNI